ncbi:MAG: pyrroline-5-carboxylate reductase [bacterium]|nr:pyrroline-5-carboxylate reductase [bacterium]
MKIGIIGTGNMGQAIISRLKSASLTVFDKDISKAERVAKKFDAVLHTRRNAKLEKTEVIIICVKPREIKNVLEFLSRMDLKKKTLISIAAGIKTRDLEKAVGAVAVIRAMPNTPALLGLGMTAVCAGKYAGKEDLKKAVAVFSKIGDCVLVKEKDMDAVTAVSGSGPAYVFLFAEELIKAGVKAGLSSETSARLVGKTFMGAAGMMQGSVAELPELRATVTSKGGTTEKAVKVLQKENFGKIIAKAVLAAKKRSAELSKSIGK